MPPWSLQSRDDGVCWPPAGIYQTYSPPNFSFQDFSLALTSLVPSSSHDSAQMRLPPAGKGEP